MCVCVGLINIPHATVFSHGHAWAAPVFTLFSLTARHQDLSERTIQHRIAAVLGVKAGPLPQSYHVSWRLPA